MSITILPAGSFGDEARDADAIGRIAELVAEWGKPCLWAVQVVCPPAIVSNAEHKARRLLGEEGPIPHPTQRVGVALRHSALLPRCDRVFINYEPKRPHRECEAIFYEVATEVFGHFRKRPAGAYAVPRAPYSGGLSDEIDGWVSMAHATAARRLCPRGYINDGRESHPDIGAVKQLADMLRYDTAVYVSGQYRGDRDLVEASRLQLQDRQYAEIGVTDRIVWCNIETAHARDGVHRWLEACG